MKINKMLCRRQSPGRLSINMIPLEEDFAIKEMKTIIIHSYLR